MKMKTFTVAATAANLHPLYHPAERGEAVFLYGMPLTISALVMGGSSFPLFCLNPFKPGQILIGYSKKRVIGVYGCMLVRCEPLPLPLFLGGDCQRLQKKYLEIHERYIRARCSLPLHKSFQLAPYFFSRFPFLGCFVSLFEGKFFLCEICVFCHCTCKSRTMSSTALHGYKSYKSYKTYTNFDTSESRCSCGFSDLRCNKIPKEA